MIGPGKYDKECTIVRERNPGAALIGVIVIGGEKGAGFSVQVTADLAAGSHLVIAAVLRDIADKIERDPPVAGHA